jgi:hypothetical protein
MASAFGSGVQTFMKRFMWPWVPRSVTAHSRNAHMVVDVTTAHVDQFLCMIVQVKHTFVRPHGRARLKMPKEVVTQRIGFVSFIRSFGENAYYVMR